MSACLRRLAALAAALVLLQVVPAHAVAPSVPDEVAAAWRTDRVYVDPGLRPAFPKTELDRIRAATRTVDFAVYVALLPRTPAVAEDRFELPTLLQARIGQPGLYLVMIVSDAYWSGNAELFRPAGLKGRQLVSVQSDDKEDSRLVRDRPAPMVVRTIQQAATAYDGRPLPPIPAADLDPVSERTGRSVTDKEDLSAFIGMGVGGVTGFVVTLFLVLRRRSLKSSGKAGRAAKPGRTAGAAVHSPALRAQADRWIGKAERALRQLESRQEKTVAVLDRRDDAVRRLDAARRLRSSDPDEVLALAGAFVLARQAQHAAAGQDVRPPCFFDPTHPSATVQAAWSDDTEVPACRTCANTVSRGDTPRGLRVRRRTGLLGTDREAVPYWTLDPEESPMVATGFGALSDTLPERVLGSSEDVR